MSELNITNVFNVSGHHNTVSFNQSNEYNETDNSGADAAQILQIVLGFVAMVIFCPIWIPLMLAQSGYKALSGDSHE